MRVFWDFWHSPTPTYLCSFFTERESHKAGGELHRQLQQPCHCTWKEIPGSWIWNVARMCQPASTRVKQAKGNTNTGSSSSWASPSAPARNSPTQTARGVGKVNYFMLLSSSNYSVINCAKCVASCIKSRQTWPGIALLGQWAQWALWLSIRQIHNSPCRARLGFGALQVTLVQPTAHKDQRCEPALPPWAEAAETLTIN